MAKLTLPIAAAINIFASEIHQNAVEHGWWDEAKLTDKEFGIVLNKVRETNQIIYFGCVPTDISKGIITLASKIINPSKTMTKVEYAEEMAECIIRMLDWAASEGINMGNLIEMKHEYNKTRPYKHGGKRI